MLWGQHLLPLTDLPCGILLPFALSSPAAVTLRTGTFGRVTGQLAHLSPFGGHCLKAQFSPCPNMGRSPVVPRHCDLVALWLVVAFGFWGEARLSSWPPPAALVVLSASHLASCLSFLSFFSVCPPHLKKPAHRKGGNGRKTFSKRKEGEKRRHAWK